MAAAQNGSCNSSHFKSFFFEQGADAGNLIALKFDGALAGGAAAAAGIAELAGQLLDHGHGNGRRKIVDDNHRLPAAMRCLASQHHAPQPGLAGRRPGWRRRLRTRRQSVQPQAGERIVQHRLRVLGQWSSYLLRHSHYIHPQPRLYKLP